MTRKDELRPLFIEAVGMAIMYAEAKGVDVREAWAVFERCCRKVD